MAHFAELDENNTVIRVLVVHNDVITVDGKEIESVGQDFLKGLYGSNNRTGVWIQTSYNHNFRKNYAGIGFAYDQSKDAFIPPQPFPTWKLDEDTCRWNAPKAYPDDGKKYYWNEDTTSWKEIE